MTNEVKKDVELTNEERQPCEVWTRVMGYPPSGAVPQHRQEGRVRRTRLLHGKARGRTRLQYQKAE